jgi:two-component system, response regulator / RNA-binding antiterminator
MTFLLDIPNFRTWSAAVVHRAHRDAEAIARQLERIGVSVSMAWPDLSSTEADVVFFDADLGYDGQFPWTPGEAPMPLIALLGSETPGRVEWAISQGADSHLLKPIGSAGIYSALVIASHNFALRQQLFAEVDELRGRLRSRPTVARAIMTIMQFEKVDEATAFRRLRRIAMNLRRNIEDAAQIVMAKYGAEDDARDSA